MLLEWKTHPREMAESVSALLTEEALLDVTLSADGGGSVRAHRVILAAASTYFRVSSGSLDKKKVTTYKLDFFYRSS